jgi:hypothetical protein
VLGLYPRRTVINTVHFLEHRMIDLAPLNGSRSHVRVGSDYTAPH